MNMKVLTIVFSGFVLLSCSKKKEIMNIQSSEYSIKNHSDSEISNAIIRAGKNRKWTCFKESKGIVRCDYSRKNHSATVHVKYNNNGFNIEHVKSNGLGEKDGKIHKKYNAWVLKLKESINSEISSIQSSK